MINFIFKFESILEIKYAFFSLIVFNIFKFYIRVMAYIFLIKGDNMSKKNILEILRENYDKFSKSERDIAQYFLNQSNLQDLTAESVSKKLFSSKSALTRFAKKCGFSGYREFIFEFQYIQKYLKEDYESLKEMTAKIFFEYTELMDETKKIVDDEQLERIAKMLDESNRVYFYGIGSSGLAAREAHLRFMRLGLACDSIVEPDIMKWTSCTLDEKCLVFGFSISGKTKPLIDALDVANLKGAKTVLLSAEKDLINKCTELVTVATSKHLHYGDRISPQLPLIFITDIIYANFKRNDSIRKEKIYKESLETIGILKNN